MNYQDIFDTASPVSFREQTKETRALISATMTGKPKTAQHRVKIGESMKGKTKTQEHRARIGQANRLARPPRAVMTPHGVFPNWHAVAEASGKSIKTVRKWGQKYPKHYYYV
jgi:hypothetical protein